MSTPGKRLAGQKAARRKTTMKRVVWVCLANGIAWVWCSYLLAYLGREEIAESLSQTAVAEIIGVVLVYALKALLEKRKDFGAVGLEEKDKRRRVYYKHYTDGDWGMSQNSHLSLDSGIIGIQRCVDIISEMAKTL